MTTISPPRPRQFAARRQGRSGIGHLGSYGALALAAALAVGAGLPLPAQVTPRAITGSVRDSAGRPLEGSVIALDPSGRSRATRADAQGRFRFDNVAPGRHELRTAWLGYRPDDRTIDVPATGIEVAIVLEVLPFRLDTLAIVARRTGIFGTTIVRADFRPLGGADVEVIGALRAKLRTGADGRFSFPDVPSGAHVVKARRSGFRTHLVSVVVPRDEAVEVAVVLDSAVLKREQLAEALYWEMERRLIRRSANGSALVGRLELVPQRGHSLDFALRYAPSFLRKGFWINNQERVYVDGRLARGMQLRDFSADEAVMLEVYANNRGIVSLVYIWRR